MKIHEYIKTLDLPHRGDCPACGHKNTFNVQEEGGQILYNCFHASCKLKGRKQTTFSLDKLKKVGIIEEKVFDKEIYKWSNPLQNEAAARYMDKYHLIDPYLDNRIKLRYDPKSNRLVFILQFEGEERGAIGRALKGEQPKWYIYERYKQCPFIVEGVSNKDTLLIVEDSTSAARVSSICSGMALLGTRFNFGWNYIKPYNRIFIALDDDASAKSLYIQRYLDLFIAPCRAVFLKKDLKYFTDEELKKFQEKEMYNYEAGIRQKKLANKGARKSI